MDSVDAEDWPKPTAYLVRVWCDHVMVVTWIVDGVTLEQFRIGWN